MTFYSQDFRQTQESVFKVKYNPLKLDFYQKYRFFVFDLVMTFSHVSMHTVKFTTKRNLKIPGVLINVQFSNHLSCIVCVIKYA